jgi:hypothetical protein
VIPLLSLKWPPPVSSSLPLLLLSLPTVRPRSHMSPNASRLIVADCCVGTLVGYVVQKGLRSRKHPKIYPAKMGHLFVRSLGGPD